MQDARVAGVERILEDQLAGLARDREPVADRRVERAVDDAEDVTGEAHRRDEPDVDTVTADDLLGADVNGLAGDEPRGRHAVAPDVHQRPAVQLAGRGARPHRAPA